MVVVVVGGDFAVMAALAGDVVVILSVVILSVAIVNMRQY
jgi:hypothetical protein